MPAKKHKKSALPLFVRAALILFVAGAAIGTALLLPAQKFELAGKSRYSAKDYETAAGLTKERLALLTADTDALIRKMENALPYANITKITRKPPNTLVLHVQDTKPAFAQKQDERWWLISEKGVLLEQADAPPEGVWIVTGIALEQPAAGQQAQWTKSRTSGSALASLMEELRKSELKDHITGVRITSGPVPDAIYQNRLRLRFGAPPPNAEAKDEILREKLRLAGQTIAKMDEQSAQQKGVLDLSFMGRAIFSTNWNDGENESSTPEEDDTGEDEDADTNEEDNSEDDTDNDD